MRLVDADKTYWEKARRGQHKNAMTYIEQILEETPYEPAAIQPLTSNL